MREKENLQKIMQVQEVEQKLKSKNCYCQGTLRATFLKAYYSKNACFDFLNKAYYEERNN